MIQIGELDRVTAIIGERGVGKSTLAKIDAREFQRDTGGYVVGHSPNGQVGYDIPGSSEKIQFHDSIDKGYNSLTRGLKRSPEKMHFVTTGEAEDVLSFGRDLAVGIKKKYWNAARMRSLFDGYPRYSPHRPAPPGLMAPPVLVVIDEGTALKGNPTQIELTWLKRLLVNARHNHMAVTWSSQAPNTKQWVILEQSNRLRIFRYTHEYGANALRAAGILKEVAYDLGDLDRFTYFQYDKLSRSRGRYRVLPSP